MAAPNDSVQLRRGLRACLTNAISARDPVAVAAFRSAAGAIDNAEAVDRTPPAEPRSQTMARATLGVGSADVARRELSAQEIFLILEAEISERESAAAEFDRLDRHERSTRLRAGASVLKAFLDTALKGE